MIDPSQTAEMAIRNDYIGPTQNLPLCWLTPEAHGVLHHNPVAEEITESMMRVAMIR